MERIAVRSKDIAIIGYDKEKKLLEVVFRQGGVYTYREVPESLHRDFLKAESYGTFFDQRIKDKFQYQKTNY